VVLLSRSPLLQGESAERAETRVMNVAAIEESDADETGTDREGRRPSAAGLELGNRAAASDSPNLGLGELAGFSDVGPG
jgi:hypothetical protein